MATVFSVARSVPECEIRQEKQIGEAVGARDRSACPNIGRRAEVPGSCLRAAYGLNW